ncbi:MAG: serine/threonine-protein kinase [Planctomycetota bacterium]|nr:serine/threonine-protein kinase [Planctomycetota bacterium]
MRESSSDTLCPECGTRIPASAPWGLCPLCLMKQAATDDVEPPREPAPTLEEVGAAFPQLDILELVGRGGMGVVYKARQKSLNRIVALKLLAPGRQADSGFTARFQREAQALAELNHPNIVTVYDFGQSGGFYFLLMEFIDGVNLRQAMLAGRFTPEQALAVVPPICEALQFAHNRGIIHRDIKPENLLIDRTGKIKIVDFGIARILRRESTDHSAGAGSDPRTRLTGMELLGTPGYMAPEQLRSPVVIDQRTDIYALGVVLYELLTGELPGRVLQPPSRRVQVDVRLDEIVLRALESQPELRFSNATEFRTRVEGLANPDAKPLDVGTARIPPAPARSVLPRMLKSGRSTLNSPEELKTLVGQFFIWRSQGTLRLDEERLIYTRGNVDTVIELAEISEMGIGQYPRSVNIAGINFIALTYANRGYQRRICLSPNNGLIGFLPSQFNREVDDWHDAILDAVVRTGHEPALIAPQELVIRSHPLTILGMLFAVLWIVFWFAVTMVWLGSPRIEPANHFPPAPIMVESPSPSVSGRLAITPNPTPPTEIEFRVQKVEVTPDSRTIVVRFERDSRYGLAIEVSQSLTAGPHGELPGHAADSRPGDVRVGLNQGNALSWTLPGDFTREEILKGARELDLAARQMPRLPEGAVPKFAVMTHRDGWKYHLIARVVREPGSAWPPTPAGAPAPEGARFTVEKQVVVPSNTIVRVTPRSATKGQARVASPNVLTFQTATDRATGFLLRWQVYSPRQSDVFPTPVVGERLILDFIDPETKVIFHRIERNLMVGMVSLSPETTPLPDRYAPLVLSEPRSSSELHLLHMSMVAPDGVTETYWMDDYLNVENLGERAPGVTPAFRLAQLRGTAGPTIPAVHPKGERLESPTELVPEHE